jgi:hypothetical protein
MRVLVKGQKGLFYEYNAHHGTKEKFEKGPMRGGNIKGWCARLSFAMRLLWIRSSCQIFLLYIYNIDLIQQQYRLSFSFTLDSISNLRLFSFLLTKNWYLREKLIFN